MRLAGRGERLLHADVQLLAAEREPDAAARPQYLWLLELGQAKQVAVEQPGARLATLWRGNLHVVEPDQGAHERPDGRSPAEPPVSANSRSKTRATPASSLSAVTSSAIASTSG